MVHKDLASDLPAIQADQTQLRQVIVNMVRNASDALGSRRGEINLRTTVTVLHEPLSGCRLTGEVPAGEWVEFAVSDTGCGMSIAVQQRLFQPFFTTKPDGHGLGMPAVLGIVRKHNGHIVCTSAEGKGTTFGSSCRSSGRRQRI